MKKLLFLFAFILFACSGSDEEQYPTITVVNATIEDNKKIQRKTYVIDLTGSSKALKL